MNFPFKAKLDRIFDRAVRRLPLRTQLKLNYFRCHKRWPNFERPSRLSELCQVTKLSERHLAPFVDKIAVKDFVRQRVGEELLIPTIYSGASLPPPDERDWPIPFIIKATHTSGCNILVQDTPDWPAIEHEVSQWLKFDYAIAHGEQFYSSVPPAILVEPLLGEGKLMDFRFYTFGGKPEAIQVDLDRHTDQKRAYFDCSWNRLDIRCKYPDYEGSIPRPAQLDRMLDMASVLGRDFPFVRVDLYEVNGEVRFSELTFTPAAGYGRFFPSEIDERWGKLWLEARELYAYPTS